MNKAITWSILGVALAAGIFGCSSVPRTAECGGAAEPARPRLMVDFADGSRLLGTLETKTIRLVTENGKVDVPLGGVVSIDVGRDFEKVIVTTANGDRLTGVDASGSLKLNAIFGRVSIDLPSVRQVRVLPPVRLLPDKLKRGRILHLSFDVDGEAQTLDTCPKYNHGKVRGAVWTPFGKSGGAYEFDGQKDYIELGPTDLYQNQGELSGCAWVFRQERYFLILSNYRGGSAYDGQFFFAVEGGGHLDVLMGQGPDQYVRYLSEEADLVPMNEWHHLAFSYNERLGEGHRIKLYLDGKDIGRYVIQREGTGESVLRNGDRLRIMAHRASGPNCFSRGKVDEVMLFNRALSAEDIRQIYDAQK